MTKKHADQSSDPGAPSPIDVLENSPLLAALMDSTGRLHHCNYALNRRIHRSRQGECGNFPDLFLPWARRRIIEEALPAACHDGLWEGEASLIRGEDPIPVHLTLVADTRDTPSRPGLLLAMMVPRSGVVETTPEEHATLPLPPPALARLAIPLYQETRFIEPERILYLGADGHYTRIHVANQVLLASQPLGSFEEELPPIFLRVHRSYVVNLARVQALVRHDGGHALRMDEAAEELIPVGRRRLGEVRQRLGAAQVE